MPTESLAAGHPTSRYRQFANRYHFPEICIALFMCYFAWRAYDFAMGIERHISEERVKAEQAMMPPEFEVIGTASGEIILCAIPPVGPYFRNTRLFRNMRPSTDIGKFRGCPNSDVNVKKAREKKVGCYKFADAFSAAAFADCVMDPRAYFQLPPPRHPYGSRAVDEM
ncbi:hypothetical protein C8Q79DRAFT_1007361 [Trametes meyenii]|nr:hypothetical protein C8Q79DRAFT_1007361 [Trametes meyenii]